ncbi:MAG: DUF4166 domain-containing protein [Fimbriimonas ginsengisoli]|uniref:DUF4166 domain-containing protein n=1 Tax=Fimbriimonas ginsengisoli TaxID=1005039 RepID=A0A931PVU6_FIMGI|nr:DUF4166 domain-containing protein [Fimbriimonas ginsengisoli]
MGESVFRKLLGPALDSVEGALRKFSDEPCAAAGSLDVVHHPGRMARFFIWILALPKEGCGQPTSIVIERSSDCEKWNRRIGASRFSSRHSIVDGMLVEKAGRFRFLHRVSVVDGGIHYHQERVYFLGIRLPLLFSPIIDANAKGDERGWKLDVTVSCPRCGPICQYSGWIASR